jgi:polysaccharide export outer membrane protein
VGDQLQLNVLQQADLDRALVVRPDGSVVVPLVGALPIAGLTIPEAEDLIRQRLRLFNRDINEVSLTVTQYNALRVFVLGAVQSAGAYSFGSLPSLWDAVRAAGGVTDEADLTAVRLIRLVGGESRVQTFDVSSMVSGQVPLPQVSLQAEDTIVVPTRQEAAMTPTPTSVQVIGGVVTPGSYNLNEPVRLIDVLLRAGGSLENSDLSSIWWVHDDGSGRHRATKVDLRRFTQRGSVAGNPLIHPGDTVQVPYRGLGFGRGVLPVLISVVGAVTAVYLAANR